MRTRTMVAALSGLVSAAAAAWVPLSPTAEATGGTTSATAPAAFAPRAITWGRCDDPDLRRAGAQCGMLVVPLDHSDPASPTIRLAVSRVVHTREPYRGIVVTNPGGPGGSGTYLATLGQYVPGKVAQTYDWYGLDPRGVGASRPALSCDGGYFGWDRPSYVPHDRSISRYWRHKTEKYAADCGAAAASRLLPYLRTTDNAADFDILRRSVGATRLTFYGFSYGTYIAQVYANLYPQRVKAMVLDGVIDPTRVFYRSNLDQDRAFQVTNDKFFAWVGKYPGTYHLGHGRKAVQRRYDRLRHRLERHAAGGKVGPDELADALLLASYYNGYYPLVASAWSALANKDRPGGIAQLYRALNPRGPGADNGYAIYLATECTDAPWPQDWATWREDTWRVHRKAPFYTWANTWFNAPCRTWPVPSQSRFQVTGSGVRAPILLTNEQFDPATPFPGALAVRRIFPTSALVEGVGGTSHAVSLSGIACTDDAVAALLRDGSLPARKSGNRADKLCPGLRPPSPAGAARAQVMPQRSLPQPSRW